MNTKVVVGSIVTMAALVVGIVVLVVLLIVGGGGTEETPEGGGKIVGSIKPVFVNGKRCPRKSINLS